MLKVRTASTSIATRNRLMSAIADNENPGCSEESDTNGNQRIVYVESISTQGKLLAVSLVTWELSSHDNGTRLIITDQLTALDGSDVAAGTRFGVNAALDNLARELMG